MPETVIIARTSSLAWKTFHFNFISIIMINLTVISVFKNVLKTVLIKIL